MSRERYARHAAVFAAVLTLLICMNLNAKGGIIMMPCAGFFVYTALRALGASSTKGEK